MKTVASLLIVSISIACSAGAQGAGQPDVPWDKLRDNAKR